MSATFIRVITLVWLILAASFASAANDARVRLWPAPDRTQLVVESAQPLEYRIISLRNPERLVLDFNDSQNAIDFLNHIDLKDTPYLGALRAARYDPKTLRVVFENTDTIAYEVRIIEPVGGYGYRLIMDIIPRDAPDPLLALIESLQSKEEIITQPPTFTVFIDAGHGGEDPGAISRNKVYEKDIVLSIALQLQDEINRREGMRAFLSRRDDRFLPLAQRVLIAHRLKADAFISIHADSVKSPKARGSSVFILSQRGASSKLAQRLAKNANLSDVIGGASSDPQLNAALPFFVKDGKDRASRQLAELVLKQIADINTLHKKHVESAGFAVLKSPFVPSILIETAFISNPQEEKKLLSVKFQKSMAIAIANGLLEYKNRYEVSE